MAFDTDLVERVRDILGPRPDLTEKKMFGGIAFRLRGNMCCGVQGNELIVRVGPEQHDEALTLPGVRPFDTTGWILVAPAGTAGTDDLIDWMNRALAFVETLPATGRSKTRARNRQT